MEIDKNKCNLVPIPKEMRLGMNSRNLYKIVDNKLYFLSYHSWIKDEDDFSICTEVFEDVVGKECCCEHYEWPNLFYMLKFLDEKRIEYPYFLNHKYDFTFTLTGYSRLSEYQNVFGYNIEKYVYLAFVNTFKFTGVCDFEIQEKACVLNEKNNELLLKLQVSDLALFDAFKPKLHFLSDFIVTTEIKERDNKNLQL
jgi:hypothetical protein